MKQSPHASPSLPGVRWSKDQRPDFGKSHGEWLADGPVLHLEISRVSGETRKRALTLGTGVSQKHLQAYQNEFTFRFNRRFYSFNAFRSLLGIAGSTPARTAAGLYSGEWQHPTCCGYGLYRIGTKKTAPVVSM
jgi:hypothetical protein